MTLNDGKSCFRYLNKLVDKYDNTYYSLDKKLINADYSALYEEIKLSSISKLSSN